jgi:hypothetical protein
MYSPDIITVGNQIKEHEMCRTCNTHRSHEKVMKNSVSIPEEKRPLGRSRHRWRGIK